MTDRRAAAYKGQRDYPNKDWDEFVKRAAIVLLAATLTLTGALAGDRHQSAGVDTAAAATSKSKAASAATKAKQRAVVARKVRQARRLRLRQFRRCEGFANYMRIHAARNVGPWGSGSVDFRGGGGAVAAPGAPAPEAASEPVAGDDFSTTNNQELGVDEADVVKTNGRTMFTVTDGALRALDVRSGRPLLLDTLSLADGAYDAKILMSGSRIVVLSEGRSDIVRPVEPIGGVTTNSLPPDFRYYRPTTQITVVNAADPKNLRVVQTATADGSRIGARLSGGYVRVVLSSPTPGPLLGSPQPERDGRISPAALDASTARNRETIAASTAGDWLPRIAVQNGAGGTPVRSNLVECDQVSIPRRYSGLNMVTVLTIDPDKGAAPIDRDAIVTEASLIYASKKSLYVATPRWFADRLQAPDFAPRGVTTTIHRFETVGPTTTYRAGGKVPGYLLSQFAMSEHNGVLRVASTTAPPWWGDNSQRQSQSYVTTLRERSGGLLKAGQVSGLGKGERIYAVRFMGDMGYVVTFRQVDPLYTVDLSRPTRPRVAGELKITGYSAYLHPVGDGLLLGVGQEATPQGRRQGAQVSLFDVSNPARPKRVSKRLLGKSWSSVEWDHHAFLYWPKTGLTMLPITVETSDPSRGVYSWSARAVGLRVTPGGIRSVGAVAHPGTTDRSQPIRRSVVVGKTVYTLSDSGVAANRLADLRPRGFLAFE